MFLTKKSFWKIMIMAIWYFLLGSACIAFWLLFNSMGVRENFLLILGLVVYALCVLMSFWGRYAEGKGKLLNLGNKLVRKELKPAEFIKHYELLRDSKDLIIRKPSIEVLQLVAIAYDVLDEREKALAAVDELMAVASEKQKSFAGLIKASLLFSYDKTDEAEALFNSITKQKLDFMSATLADAVLKGDRAKAMGDYRTVEANNLQLLERKFPKLDNLGKLITHCTLGEVYEKLGEKDKAITYYQYCVDFGGETAIKAFAGEKLQHFREE